MERNSFLNMNTLLFIHKMYKTRTVTSRHGHRRPSHHPHGHPVRARSGYGSRVDGGGDAVGLNHGGVVDDMRLGRVHRLCVVSTLKRRHGLNCAHKGQNVFKESQF